MRHGILLQSGGFSLLFAYTSSMPSQQKLSMKVDTSTHSATLPARKVPSTRNNRSSDVAPWIDIASELNAKQYGLLFQNMPLGIMEED